MNKQDLDRFIERWSGSHGEEQDARSFILELLGMLGIDNPTEVVQFEKKVTVKKKYTFGQRRRQTTTKRIDAYLPDTKVLIEMKGTDVDLDHLTTGEYDTAYEQAKSYYDGLKLSEKGRWIVTSNFHEIRLYDMENPIGKPVVINLNELTDSNIHALDILVDKKYTDQQIRRIHMEQQLSIKAGELVGELYRLLLARLHDPTKEQMKDLNILIVRLVFCFYAEDGGLFKPHQFHDYLKQFRPERMNRALSELFIVLDTSEADRDADYMDDALLDFPYVNGGLFSQEIRIPVFTPEIVDYILEYCSESFDWSGISPTIFGALFESTLNPEDRAKGGMHYTSVENIHKVIDPLFLDNLKEELNAIKDIRRESTRHQAVFDFQSKLSSLTFFDPACGSGNFLTESYLSLRRLENEALKCDSNGAQRMGDDVIIMVSIQQFYGIEINDFAVAVATTALYIAEAQMYKETKKFLPYQDTFLPLRSYTNIHEGNALRMNWRDIITPSRLSYILGNPPFLGYYLQTQDQKDDIRSVYVDEYRNPYRFSGKIDYVSGWFFKACEMMERNKRIEAAFVSTSSICEGEQVVPVWKPLKDRFGIQINFAYSGFYWANEATEQADVYVVIIGFSLIGRYRKYIYWGGRKDSVRNINFYLMDGDDILVLSRKSPICDVPVCIEGSKAADGGYLFFTKEEYLDIVKKYPETQAYLKRFLGSSEFIYDKDRFCLWIPDPLIAMKAMKNPVIRQRVEKVKEFRLASPKGRTRRSAETPYAFQENRQPKDRYILIPRHTSYRRYYIPLGFFDENVIVGDAAQFVPNATLYEFGVLQSSVHMGWVRTVGGRLKEDYRYSKSVVYDTFPWPNPTESQKNKIKKTALAILEVRTRYLESTLSELYDPLTMPIDLRRAHYANDRAVKEAYGFTRNMNEEAIVAELMRRYQALVNDKD